MRCTHCGSIIPPGVQRCPICGASPDSLQAQEDFRLHKQYPKMNAPAQTGIDFTAMPDEAVNRPDPFAPDPYAQPGANMRPPADAANRYATPAFHTYRQQVFTGPPQTRQAVYDGQSRDSFNPGGAFSNTLSDLPQIARGAFTSPTATIQGMIRREDRFTGVLLLALSAIFAFLAGMILVKGALGAVFAVAGGVTGLQLADSAASLNQGVAYLAGKINVSIGGIAAVCQLIAASVPVAVTALYLCLVRKVRFSFPLLNGLTAVAVLPGLAALVLASVLSLISPYLSAFTLLCGQAAGYVMLCSVATQLIAVKPQRAVLTQTALVCVSELLKIVLIALIGGALLSGVLHTLSGLTNSMGGLL